MWWGPSAAFSTCVIPRVTNRGLCWAVALWTTQDMTQGMNAYVSSSMSMWLQILTGDSNVQILYLPSQFAKYGTYLQQQFRNQITILQQKWECHLRVSDVEVGPNLVDSSSGASVLQQKAEQIAGRRCLVLWLLLWPHIHIFQDNYHKLYWTQHVA